MPSIYQDVSIVFDKRELISNEDAWYSIRNYLYDLRDFSFLKDCSIRISFSFLDNVDGDSSEIQFFDLDTFSISDSERDAYFKNQGFDSLNYYFSTVQNQNANNPIVVIFYEKEIKNIQNYNRLNALPFFSKSKRNLKNISSLHVSESVNIKNTQEPSENISQKIKQIKIPKIPKLNRKIILVSTSILFASVLAYFFMPIMFEILKPNKFCKVYTGDGDRLVLRKEPNQNGEEIMRINENETVRVLSVLPNWREVEYHEFKGFLNNDYLIVGQKSEYKITAPYAMFEFGRALLKYNKNNLGKEYIEKSANNNCISAQYEMGNFSYGNREKILWFEKIHDTNFSTEDALIQNWKKVLNACNSSEKDRIRTLKTNIATKEDNIKLIRQLSSKKLSELYLILDNEKAANYYELAIKYGIKSDSDYMYTLANNLSGDKKIEWLKKAANKGHEKSIIELANYFDSIGNKNEAVKFYSKSSTSSEAAYYCGVVYWDRRYYYSAYSYFKKAVNIYDYSEAWYEANYALGLCYEYGYGVGYKDKKTALNYYSNARSRIKEAQDAYNRVYNEVYYSW